MTGFAYAGTAQPGNKKGVASETAAYWWNHEKSFLNPIPGCFSPTKNTNSAVVKTICTACCFLVPPLSLCPSHSSPVYPVQSTSCWPPLKPCSCLNHLMCFLSLQDQRAGSFFAQDAGHLRLAHYGFRKASLCFFMGNTSVVSTESPNYLPSNPSLKVFPCEKLDKGLDWIC